MRPTDLLRVEHDQIDKGLQVLSAMCDLLRHGRPVPTASVWKLVEFFRAFADVCHHAKEEQALFPALERARLAQIGQSNVPSLVDEHRRGHELLKALEEQIPMLGASEGARHLFIDAAGEYQRVLARHVELENETLFPMAERFLGDALTRDVAAHFARIERGLIAAGVKERLEGWLEELAREFLPKGTGPSASR